MTPDYCSKNPCNCWWDCYINGAVLELSSISPREISEFQKITYFEQNPEKKADENVVVQYLLFSRTFSLRKMSVLCLNENIKGRGWGFVYNQISKYLNYSIVMKLTLFCCNVPLCRSIIVCPLAVLSPLFFLLHFCSKTEVLQAFQVYMKAYSLTKSVLSTDCNLSVKFTSHILPRNLTLHYLCLSLLVSKPTQLSILLHWL